LLSAIRDYQRDHPGVIYRAGGGSEYRFRLPAMQSGRHPDVAVTLRNTPRDWRGFRRASMAFEVVSKGAEARERDYVTKRAEYLAYGLLECWIVDPQEKTVIVLVRDGDAGASTSTGMTSSPRAWSWPASPSGSLTSGARSRTRKIPT